MIRFSFLKKLKAAGGDMLLDVDASIAEGSLVALYGASGAGKTSILRMIAGLMEPERGHLEVNQTTWLDTRQGIRLKPQERRTGFVFQDYALFPNMTVRQNLQYALDKNQDAAIVEELIETVELGSLQHRKPGTLSGGQQQRVALARALVRRPEILLLDEPLSALDQAMRLKLQDYILKVHRRFGLTTLLVSHDVNEVLRMAGEVIVLENGRIGRHGPAAEIFSSEKMGIPCQLTGEVTAATLTSSGWLLTVRAGDDFLKIPVAGEAGRQFAEGDRVVVNTALLNPAVRRAED